MVIKGNINQIAPSYPPHLVPLYLTLNTQKSRNFRKVCKNNSIKE